MERKPAQRRATDLPRVAEHRRDSDLSPVRKLLYPVVYGDRRYLRGERVIKPVLDRVGVWTARR